MAEYYRIVIGDPADPLMIFDSNTIKSVTGEVAVDLIGDVLAADELEIIVQADDEASAELYVPADYDAVKSADGYLFATSWTPENETKIYEIPYGTTVRYYVGSELRYKLYFVEAKRVERYRYQIKLTSAIGIFGAQIHTGGVYTGQTFAAVAAEIIGDSIPYSVEADVAAMQVFGWLPYAEKRDNLHQLLFSAGAILTKDENKDLVFSFAYATEPEGISAKKIYLDGTIQYPAPASRVEVTEYSYQQLPTDEEVLIFDNEDTEAVENKLVVFNNAPVWGIRAEGLTIHEQHPNYAILSGSGKLYGKPYNPILSVVVREPEGGNAEGNVKKADGCTLVSVANSENVADRLASYFSTAKTVETSIVLSGEECGRRYSFVDMYGEPCEAYLSKMELNGSAITKAFCTFIDGYVPTGQGNNYNHAVVLTGTGRWEIPEEVLFNEDGTLKEHPRIRVVVIGGGDGGEAGDRGQDGVVEMDDGEVVSSGIDNDGFGGMPVGWEKVGTSAFSGGLWMPRASGGTGGAGGAGGTPGKILTRTVDVTGLARIEYACGTGGSGGTVRTLYGNLNEYGNYEWHNQQKTAPGSGTHTTFGDPEDPLLDSDDGATSTYGYLNVFDGQRYGAPGIDGAAGGNGGDYVAGKGEDVTFNGQTWTGGRIVNNGQPEAYGITDWLSDEENYYGGAGGGAAVGSNGSPGGNYRQFTRIWREVNGSGTVTDERERVWRNVYGNGGDGGNAAKGANGANYGAGGNGGHGGGGGGATGFGYVLNSTHYGSGYGYFTHTLNDYLLATKNTRTGDTEYENLTKAQTRFGYGGDGGDGGRGGDGCVIIFY